MSKAAPEFSRPVPLARIGAEPFRVQVEATAEERQRLACRFGLLSLDRLSAMVTLARKAGGLIRLDAEFEAEFCQTCVVSLDPVAGALCQDFALIYGPSEEAAPDIVVAVDEPAFEPLSDDAIDVGEAVAQELSLALPDFPRSPDAAVEPAATGLSDAGVFAGLAKWRGLPER